MKLIPEQTLLLASVVAIAVACVALYYMKSKKVDNFCGACTGIGCKTCLDRDMKRALYQIGEVTEFSELKDKGWDRSCPNKCTDCGDM